jgi:hypothetical protein
VSWSVVELTIQVRELALEEEHSRDFLAVGVEEYGPGRHPAALLHTSEKSLHTTSETIAGASD